MERHQQFINLLKSEYEAEVEKYKHKLVEVSAMHANEIKLLRENHNRIIEDIKYEYTSMVENLKQIKETENTAIDKANVYSAKLDHNLELLDVNSKTLNAISGKIHQDHNILTVAREESFKIKEKEIQCK